MKVSGKIIVVIIVTVIILIAVTTYMIAKRKTVKVPGNGDDIPAGWEPLPTVVALHNAMSGLGTNEDIFFSTMEPLTLGQRALVYNTFLEQYDESIILWIQDEFTGDELSRALAYFKDLPGISLRLLRSVVSYV